LKLSEQKSTQEEVEPEFVALSIRSLQQLIAPWIIVTALIERVVIVNDSEVVRILKSKCVN
jgi:hypothetical protein